MFQHAVDRITPLFPPERILVVTRNEHAALLMAQVSELPAENFILEPEGRGTAPAIGLAAIHLKRRGPDASMVVLTADHYLTDAEEFRHALIAALQVAETGQLVTCGIQPTAPSTGFGYIQHGATLQTPAYETTLKHIWPRVAKQTIDYGIMEKAQAVAVIPVSIGWTDAGSWGSLLTLLPADKDGNTVVGPHVGLNTHDTLAFSDKRLIATIGVRGLVIVARDDAVLVCPKEKEQAVRELVDTLKRDGYSRLL
jgi:mannose-1-phosphate guanylyltransferase